MSPIVFAVPRIFSKHVPWLEGETSWNHPSTGICTVPQVIIRKTPASTTSWLLRMYGCSCASSSLHPSVFSWFFRLSFLQRHERELEDAIHFHLQFENKKWICPTRETPSFNLFGRSWMVPPWTCHTGLVGPLYFDRHLPTSIGSRTPPQRAV